MGEVHLHTGQENMRRNKSLLLASDETGSSDRRPAGVCLQPLPIVTVQSIQKCFMGNVSSKLWDPSYQSNSPTLPKEVSRHSWAQTARSVTSARVCPPCEVSLWLSHFEWGTLSKTRLESLAP